MVINPSIVLEGASKAADWIPFAKSMLNGMTGDGTRNSAPAAKITIVVTRYGNAGKIYINAGYPDGARFVGRPYDEFHEAGWGSPYNPPADPEDPDDQNFKGTEGSHDASDVIVERVNSIGPWVEKRFPQYLKDFPTSEEEELEYGNLDWTSADGQTALTWDGINSRHYGGFADLAGTLQGSYCCSENIPDNEWHAGAPYPGFVITNGENCNDSSPSGVFRINYSDGNVRTPTGPHWAFSNKIYKDGEVLVTIPHEYEFVNGAAIQTVTDDTDGTVTQYLVAVIALFKALGGVHHEKLFRVPMDSLETLEGATYEDLGAQKYNGFTTLEELTQNTNCWEFNSTGDKAVAIRRYVSASSGEISGKVVVEMEIAADGTFTHNVLWSEEASGLIIKMDHKGAFYDPGETATYEGTGAAVIGAAYKDDVLNYAVIGGTVSAEYGITIDDPAEGCDTLTETINKISDTKFAFTNTLPAKGSTVGGSIVALESNYTDYHTETNVNPAYRYEITSQSNEGFPIFIDCRKDIAVIQRRVAPKHKYVILQGDIGIASLYPDAFDPTGTYNHDMSLEVYIDGIEAYSTGIYRTYRAPGDCLTISDYGIDAGAVPCDLVSVTSYSVKDFDDEVSPPVSDGPWAESFACVQTHDDGSEEGGFDILISMRTRLIDYDAPVVSFVGRWDGEEIVDIEEIEELLELDNNGILAPTGKI